MAVLGDLGFVGHYLIKEIIFRKTKKRSSAANLLKTYHKIKNYDKILKSLFWGTSIVGRVGLPY